MTSQIATIASVFFAAAAAALWAWSATVNLPILGSGWGALVNAEPFYAAMKKVARLNMAAATSAFLSALFQAVAYFAGA